MLMPWRNKYPAEINRSATDAHTIKEIAPAFLPGRSDAWFCFLNETKMKLQFTNCGGDNSQWI